MTRRRRFTVTMIVCVVVTAAACTGDGVRIELGSPAPSGSAATTPTATAPGSQPGRTGLTAPPIDTGEEHALPAMRALCVPPTPVSTDDDGAPGETPSDVRTVEGQVEQVRELEFLRPVAVQPASAAEIADKLRSAFDETYPKEFYDRRTVAWQTIGLLPGTVTLRDALLAFQTGQVVGFYNPVDGELVYRADGDLGLGERVILAHELTHAIDDQHFDLARIDDIAAGCRDEPFQAALGAVEGSAQFFAVRVLFEFPPADGDFSGLGGGGGMPDGVPPFVASTLLWPYSAGQAFVADLSERGGIAEVNGALRRFPVTTEQILHPERFPDDAPTRVDVRDLGPELGSAWGDLDVMQVGEAPLSAMLSLRLDQSSAEAAAAGWDGGIYRAFTDGRDSVVVFDTAWDSTAEADAFAQAIREWFEAEGSAGVVGRPSPQRVAFAMSTTNDERVNEVMTQAVA